MAFFCFSLSLKPLVGLLALLCLPRACDAIVCYECEGFTCGGKDTPTCEGDYCWASTILPSIGHRVKFGDAKFVKGCISGGTQLSYLEYYKNQCLRYKEGKNLVKTCNCEKDYCNKGSFAKQMKTVDALYMECVCEGFDYCSKKHRCIGELCTYVQSKKTNEVTKGCLNTTVPIMEHQLIDTCVSPAFIGGLHHNVLEPDKALNYEMCVCSTDNCNEKKPQALYSKKHNCSMELAADFKGLSTRTKEKAFCQGEFCYQADMEAGGLKASSLGCINYLKSNQDRHEIGCVKAKAPDVEVRVCIGGPEVQLDDEEDEESGPGGEDEKSEQEEEKELDEAIEKEVDKERKEDEAAEKYTKEREANKAKGASPSGEKGQKERTPEEREKESREREKSPRNLKEPTENGPKPGPSAIGTSARDAGEKEEDKEISSNNTAIVAVFVVIIVLIIVVGLAWKFELPKKLFQARYQTVGG